MANWTPEGFIGQVFKTLGRHVPPPAGVESPALWGTRGRIAELFGEHAADDRGRRRATSLPLPLARAHAGRLPQLLRPGAQGLCRARRKREAALAEELIELMGRFNRAGDGPLVVPSDYLEVVITRR